MKDALKNILEMDKTAQKKVIEAQKYRAKSLAELNARKTKIVEEETNKVRELALRRSNKQKAAGEAYLNTIHDRNRRIMAGLDKQYADNKQIWLEKIIENVTK